MKESRQELESGGIIYGQDELDGIEDQVFPDNLGGKFKIEIAVNDDAMGTASMLAGVLKVWLSASAVGGNCDESVYFCRYCHHPLLPDDLGVFDRDNDQLTVKPYHGAKCPPRMDDGSGGCGRLNRGEHMIDFREIRRPLEDWLDVLEWYHQLLHGDVDYYLKRFRGRIMRSVADRKDATTPWERTRANVYAMNNYVDKEVVLYSLPRVIADTQSGASLRSALKAFLTA